MHCRELGTRGPHVVLLHGIPGSAATWDGVAERLAETCRVVVPDLIGFGESDRSTDIDGLGAEEQAVALEAALDRLGVERVVLAGHDFGGPVALTLLRRRPELVSGLALIATNAFPDTPVPLPLRAVCWPLIGRVAEQLLFSGPSLRVMLRRGASRRLDARRYLGDRAERTAIRVIFAASLRELSRRYAEVETALRGAPGPTLIAWGDSDPFFTVDQGRRTAAAGHARFALYPGCGHFVPEERPDELAEDLRRLAEESERSDAAAA